MAGFSANNKSQKEVFFALSSGKPCGGGGVGGGGWCARTSTVDFSVTSDEQYRTFLPCCGCCTIRFFNRRNIILSLSIECL